MPRSRSRTRSTRRSQSGFGVLLDDVAVTLTGGGGTLTDQTSLEFGTGGWVASNPASENRVPVASWTARRAIGFGSTVGVATRGTQYWGFGLEGVSDAQTRTALIGEVMRYLGVDPGSGDSR